MNLFTLMATIGLNASNFVQGIRSATSAGQQFASDTSKSISAGIVAMGNLMAKAVEVAGKTVIDLGKMGLEYNSQMENYTTNFRVMLGSEEAAVEKVAELREMAAATPFGMEDLAAGTQTLLQFGIEANEVTGILSMLGDVSLGDKNKLNSLTLAFAQMSSTGKLTGQDLNQMINAGFNPLQVIAEETGASIGDLKEKMADGKGSRDFQKQIKAAQKEVKKFGDEASLGAKLLAQIGTEGEISADLVAKAFELATNEGGQFYNGMEEASKTLSGQLSTLEDNSTALIGRFFEPVSEMLSSSILPKVNEFVDVLTAAYDEGGFGNMLTVGVNWALGQFNAPSVDEIKTQVSDWWNGRQGENAYETIKNVLSWTWGEWISPTGSSISSSVSTWWTNTALPRIKSSAKWTWGELIVPAWSDIEKAVSDWWNNDIVSKIQSTTQMIWGGFEFPTWDDVKQKAEDWWFSIKQQLAQLFSFDINIGGFSFGETDSKIASTGLLDQINKPFDMGDIGSSAGAAGFGGGGAMNGITVVNHIASVPQTPRELTDEMMWSLQRVRFSV